MARILSNENMTQIDTVNNLKFSAIRVDKLGATEYTLVTICIDMSGSVQGFKSQLVECVQNVVEACKSSPRSNYLLVRVTTFNYGVIEEHGFINLSNIDSNAYTLMENPRGLTVLYDATINSIEATSEYAKQLDAEEIDVNGIIFVITDGDNTSGKSNSAMDVARARAKISKSESIESLQMFLVGVNNDNPSFADDLRKFKNMGNFDDFIDATNSSPDTLAKLAQFVSKSISNQSQALGTGGPSQVINSF